MRLRGLPLLLAMTAALAACGGEENAPPLSASSGTPEAPKPAVALEGTEWIGTPVDVTAPFDGVTALQFFSPT